jgi:hypothetical protein
MGVCGKLWKWGLQMAIEIRKMSFWTIGYVLKIPQIFRQSRRFASTQVSMMGSPNMPKQQIRSWP